MIVPVGVSFLYLVVLIFHRFFLHCFEILLKRMSSRQYMCDVDGSKEGLQKSRGAGLRKSRGTGFGICEFLRGF